MQANAGFQLTELKDAAESLHSKESANNLILPTLFRL